MGKRFAQVLWFIAGLLTWLAVYNFYQTGFTGGGVFFGFFAVPAVLIAFVLGGPPWRLFSD